MSNNNVFQKGDKVLNPKTNRFVVVGGPSWKKLVLEGVLSGAYKEANSSKQQLKTELVFNEELENNPPEVVVIAKKPRARRVKQVPIPVETPAESVESQGVYSDEDNLEEMELKLAEILKQQEKDMKKAPKKAGRPKKSRFETKVIVAESESEDASDA
jgi:hypothetical protein